jgi:hypothetical protein
MVPKSAPPNALTPGTKNPVDINGLRMVKAVRAKNAKIAKEDKLCVVLCFIFHSFWENPTSILNYSIPCILL